MIKNEFIFCLINIVCNLILLLTGRQNYCCPLNSPKFPLLIFMKISLLIFEEDSSDRSDCISRKHIASPLWGKELPIKYMRLYPVAI
jgi:hypothetical protein